MGRPVSRVGFRQTWTGRRKLRAQIRSYLSKTQTATAIWRPAGAGQE